jgi:muramoyltetrapeptide carboxypeptidase
MRFGHIGQKHSFPLGATCQLSTNKFGGYQLAFSGYPTIKADAIHVEGLWQ